MWHHKLRKGGVGAAKLLADVGSELGAGIAGLPQDITINGTTVSPTFRYEGKDATLSSWAPVVGETLTAAGSGGTVGLYTPLPDDTARAVNGGGTRYWQGSDAALVETSNGDIVLETVMFIPEYTGYSGVVAANQASRFAPGWRILRQELNASTTRFVFYFYGQIGNNLGYHFADAGSGQWVHMIWLADNSGFSSCYLNSSLSGASISFPISEDSLENSAALTINALGDGSFTDKCGLAYAAMWQRDAWLDSHLQPDIAQERFARLTGSYVPGWQAWPTQASLRNSAATLERQTPGGGQQLFTVGARWPRLEKVPDKFNRYASGFMVEGQHTNLITHSEQLDDASWAKTRCTIDANSGDGPDAETTMDTIVEDGTASDTHYVEASFTQAADTYTFRAVVEAINRSWVQLELDSATDGAASAYFDVSSCVVGTESGNDTANIRYLGNGLYELWLVDTRATAEACNARIYASSGNDGRSFDGASQDSVRVVGMQVTATPYPVSYIKTEGAAVTRLAEAVEYTGQSLPSKGSLACDVLMASEVAANGYAATISDGGASTDRVACLIESSSDVGRTLVDTGGFNQASVDGSTEMDDRLWRELRAYYGDDDVRTYVNGSSEGIPDTSATMPSGLDVLHIGTDNTGALHLNGRVRVRLFSKPTIKNVTEFK